MRTEEYRGFMPLNGIDAYTFNSLQEQYKREKLYEKILLGLMAIAPIFASHILVAY